jgi:hypothetical protein
VTDAEAQANVTRSNVVRGAAARGHAIWINGRVSKIGQSPIIGERFAFN